MAQAMLHAFRLSRCLAPRVQPCLAMSSNYSTGLNHQPAALRDTWPKPSFDLEKMTALIDHDNLSMRKEMREFLRDPVFTPRYQIVHAYACRCILCPLPSPTSVSLPCLPSPCVLASFLPAPAFLPAPPFLRSLPALYIELS